MGLHRDVHCQRITDVCLEPTSCWLMQEQMTYPACLAIPRRLPAAAARAPGMPQCLLAKTSLACNNSRFMNRLRIGTATGCMLA